MLGTVGDINRDGLDDLFVAYPTAAGPTRIDVIKGNRRSCQAGPMWTASAADPMPIGKLKVESADLNFDGQSDLVLYRDRGDQGTTLLVLRGTYKKLKAYDSLTDPTLDWATATPYLGAARRHPLPSGFVRPHAELVARPDQWQSQQLGIEQQALRHLRGVHAQVLQACVPVGLRFRVQELLRPEALDESPQLAGRGRPLREIDEADLETAFAEETERVLRRPGVLPAEDLDQPALAFLRPRLERRSCVIRPTRKPFGERRTATSLSASAAARSSRWRTVIGFSVLPRRTSKTSATPWSWTMGA